MNRKSLIDDINKLESEREKKEGGGKHIGEGTWQLSAHATVMMGGLPLMAAVAMLHERHPNAEADVNKAFEKNSLIEVNARLMAALIKIAVNTGEFGPEDSFDHKMHRMTNPFTAGFVNYQGARRFDNYFEVYAYIAGVFAALFMGMQLSHEFFEWKKQNDDNEKGDS